MNTNIPYANLTPHCVLDAVENLGLRCDGRLLQLNSFENRVYQVGIDDGSQLVAKFYRPGRWSNAAILEEHDFTLQIVQQEIPVVPPILFNSSTLHDWEGYRFALFAKQGGRAPDLESEEALEWLGRFLGRIHAVGATVEYQQRPSINLQTFGSEPRDYLIANNWIPQELKSAWESVVMQALDEVGQAYDRAGDIETLRLHGDCHAGNILWTEDGPHFVDFDDSRRGPAIQDLWMLLSGDEVDMRRQFTALMQGYEIFREFDDRELHLVEALRTLRLINYCAWIALRWEDPAFPAAFPWFGSMHYWQDRILELREQIALMQEPPLL